LTYDNIVERAKQSPRFLSVLRQRCEDDLLTFVCVMFPCVYGYPFIVSKHHRPIVDALNAIYEGQIDRLIINMPPGYSKTELVVVMFSAWCLAKEPRSRFMHASYSNDLALANSSKVKDIIESPLFTLLWGTKVRNDTSAKKEWSIVDHGGMFLAVPLGGQVTGRRAGVMGLRTFSGALVIDDPMKPEDAYSRLKREVTNRRFMTTVRNRVAIESTPIIIIMQRLHVDDLSGVLLRGASGDCWHHLSIPVEYDPKNTDYPKEFTHGKPVAVSLNAGPIWKTKHTANQLTALRNADKFTYSAQYMQCPVISGGSIFDVAAFGSYSSYDGVHGDLLMKDGALVRIRQVAVFADTAHKTGQQNDYSVLAVWGKGVDGRIYLLDLVRAKLEAPALKQTALALFNKWKHEPGQNTLGVRDVFIEDKASGIGLIQELRREAPQIHVVPVPRNKDKVSRAYSSAPAIAEGRVVLPVGASWLREFVAEHEDFSPNMTHRHDDQVDTTMDAIQMLLQNNKGAITYKGAM
jgi:predicted phage terminase large subunit-like protein